MERKLKKSGNLKEIFGCFPSLSTPPNQHQSGMLTMTGAMNFVHYLHLACRCHASPPFGGANHVTLLGELIKLLLTNLGA